MISLRCCYNNLQQFNDMQDSLENRQRKVRLIGPYLSFTIAALKAGVNLKTYRERTNTGNYQR